jgi:hypothetical protein
VGYSAELCVCCFIPTCFYSDKVLCVSEGCGGRVASLRLAGPFGFAQGQAAEAAVPTFLENPGAGIFVVLAGGMGVELI